jgi:hypothetical protein
MLQTLLSDVVGRGLVQTGCITHAPQNWRQLPTWLDIVRRAGSVLGLDAAYADAPAIVYIPKGAVNPMSPLHDLQTRMPSEVNIKTVVYPDVDEKGAHAHTRKVSATAVVFLGVAEGDIDGDGVDDFHQFTQSLQEVYDGGGSQSENNGRGGLYFRHLKQWTAPLLGSATIWSRLTARGLEDPRAEAEFCGCFGLHASPYQVAFVSHFFNVPDIADVADAEALVNRVGFQHSQHLLPDL